MKKILFIFVSVFLFLSNGYSAYIKNGTYTVKYRYINYAVSPTVGNQRYKVLIKNKKAIQVLDLKRGILISPQQAYGLPEVMRVLLGNKSNIKISNKDGTIVFKTKKTPACTTFVYIDKLKRVLNNYTLNPIYERKKELLDNYRKWLKKRISYYLFRVQDSRFKNKYPEGVELTVKNGRIIDAKDVRSLRPINPNNKYFLNVKKLFGVAQWGIKDAIIDYDSNYYYPILIKLKNGITITSSYLQPLRG